MAEQIPNFKIMTTPKFNPVYGKKELVIGYGWRQLDTDRIEIDEDDDMSYYGIGTDLEMVLNMEENVNYRYFSHEIEPVETDQKKDFGGGKTCVRIEYHLTVMMERR